VSGCGLSGQPAPPATGSGSSCCGGPTLARIPVPTVRDRRIRRTAAVLTHRDRLDHLLARWGYRREWHRVEPGLYALGEPTRVSSVFVTANYTLSFDALRSALVGIDAYILVLDTLGINVWCAAGKDTFGTDELVRRIEAVGLHQVVDHRVLILPQLGAPGVAAHEVASRSGFAVEYGPVRAADLPAYLRDHQATPEMRRVRFGLWDRAVLIPVELMGVFVRTLIAAVVLHFLVGPLAGAGVWAAVLAGVALFPILLPWLPTHDFSSKGFVLGALVAIPFAAGALLGANGELTAEAGMEALAYLLGLPPVTAYLALNFTGATTFTSRTGVRREMRRYIPAMAWTFAAGVLWAAGLTLLRVLT
jgi:hypothetical protein